MSSKGRVILERLATLGFNTQSGPLAPFDGPLPLVIGTAWDGRTAQLVLVAEAEAGDFDAPSWQELLFAAGGLRHHLSRGERPGLGAPVVLALVDGEAQVKLRELVEDLTANYALFDRVDLNLVSGAAIDDPDALDSALAPLLPRCRELDEGATIGMNELRQFWSDLRSEVHAAARRETEHGAFDDVRERIGDELADALIEDADQLGGLDAPAPVSKLAVSNFRSFAAAEVSFAQITILQGTNGSGKTSLIEALELLWACDTQRRPTEDEDGSPSSYAEYLRRDGEHDFAISGTLRSGASTDAVTHLSDRPRAELARCVLTQDQVASLVNSSPKQRMRVLTSITGLEIPDIDARTSRIRDEARKHLDRALEACDMSPLARADANGIKHVAEQLRGGYLDWAPSLSALTGAEQALSQASQGTYEEQDWSSHADLAGSLADLDAKLDRLSESLDGSQDLSRTVVKVAKRVSGLAATARGRARPVNALVDRIAAAAVDSAPAPPRDSGPIPPSLAARWHAHSQSLEAAADEFGEASKRIDDERWSMRLQRYVEELRSTAELAPRDELRKLAGGSDIATVREPTDLPPVLFKAAGFASAPKKASAMLAPLRELGQQLDRYATQLEELSEEIELHPVAAFIERRDRLLEALCRFQIARAIRRKGPIDRASRTLLSELLKTRLEPVLQELVSAMSRFEWYFKPLSVLPDGPSLVIGGGATSKSELDIRMLLNSGERTIVGLGWFLALHLLQPPDRRRVLVLDDPSGALDSSNLAGFTATLRAFVRLVRPEQVVLATHDDSMALILQDELVPVDSWPDAVARVRCRRDGDVSVVEPVGDVVEHAGFDREQELLTLSVEHAAQ